MPQEYRHLILPDTYYFDVSILPERGLIQNYILTKKILNIILNSLLSILITLLGYKIDTTQQISKKFFCTKKIRSMSKVTYSFHKSMKEIEWSSLHFLDHFIRIVIPFFSYSFFGSKMKTDYPGIEREWSNPKSVYNIGYPGINRKYG